MRAQRKQLIRPEATANTHSPETHQPSTKQPHGHTDRTIRQQQGRRLRIGTVRRPPRGVRKEDYASKDIYDVWFPNLSPSEALLREAFPVTDDKTWRAFKRRFLAEMKAPEARRDLDLLAALSHHANFSIGCYCEDESRCHRSILKALLDMRGAEIS